VREESPTQQRTQSETFARDDREIARARHVVVRTLNEWGMAAEAAVMQVLVSELVTNALVHGAGPIGVRLDDDGERVRLEVTDDNGTPTAPHLVDDDRVGGWGLQLVDRLADRWGAEHEHHTTRVWTEMRSPRGTTTVTDRR
jgi:anti-sigma regulatory factor (Ser/Thr protein kinase)